MNNAKILLKLLKFYLDEEEFALDLSYEQLHSIMQDAITHQIHPIIYDVLSRLPQTEAIGHLLSEYKPVLLFASVRDIRSYELILQTLDRLYAENIDVIALKGLFIKSLYTKTEHRTMGDADVVILDISQLEKALMIFETAGYKTDAPNNDVYELKSEKGLIKIELHGCLKDATRKSTFTSDELHKLFGCCNPIWEECNGKRVLTIPHTGHFMYLLMHIAVHFMSGGFGFRQLLDIAIFAKIKQNDINWNEFSNAIERLGEAKFTYNIFMLLKNYLGVDVTPKLSFSTNSCADHSDELLEYIYNCGVFGRKGDENAFTNGIAGKIMSRNIVGKRAFFNLLFPRDVLKDQYSYALKYKILLPIAWTHRIFTFIKKELKKSSIKAHIDGLKKVDDRIRFVQKFDFDAKDDI